MTAVRATKDGAEVTRLFSDRAYAEVWADFMASAGYVVEIEGGK